MIVDHDGVTSVDDLDGRWFIVGDSDIVGRLRNRAPLRTEIETAIRSGRHLGESRTRTEAEMARALMCQRWIDRRLGLA